MRRILVVAAAMTLAAGSAWAQMGPTVPVSPPPNKPYDEFQQDVYLCRQYADQQVAGAQQQSTNQVVGGALIGTVAGAGIGALAGGGRGAAIGAGAGAVVGTLGGAAQAQQSQAQAQRRYDVAYGQCMYGRGDLVSGYPAPAAAYPAPPPPPGYPPGYYAQPGYAQPGYAPPAYAPPPPPPPPYQGYYPQTGYAPPPPGYPPPGQ
ncbi:MAG TPA: YMGG-like glycine zipper-containing protein [Stellaceae bacterium]|nr:YMGG-like glycine zipper-containing protein [Stellaceae bacterium]